MVMKEVNKRGVSPVIATVLLIAIVIILAMIIFLWARGFVEEKAQKEGRAVEFSCEEVNFEPGVFCGANGCVLEVTNKGNIPLYGFEIKILGSGEVIVRETLESQTVTVGDSVSVELFDLSFDDVGKEILVVPVILGQNRDGIKIAHTCTDNNGFASIVKSG